MTANNETVCGKSIGLLLLTSGCIGFSLGAFVCGTNQVAVQFGQILADIVNYPTGSPEGIIQRQVWCFPILFSAFGLRAGLSEVTLSFLVSGLVGMLSFQALGLLTYAVSNRLWIAILSPLVIFYSGATNLFGGVYPVMLMGFPHTNGMVGLSYVLLLITMLGVGWHRAAALLLGMAPAWHMVTGGLMWVVISTAWILNYKKPWKQTRPLVGWLFTGVFIALAGFWIQRMNMPPLPDISTAEVKRHLSFFIQNWDAHRHPVDFSSSEVVLNLLGLAVCYTHLKKNASGMPERLRLMFSVFLIAGILALIFGLLTHLPLSWLPLDFTRAMPARLLNVFVISYAAIVLGILTRDSNEGPEPFFASVLLILLLVAAFLPPVMMPSFVLCALVLGGAIILLLTTRASTVFDLTAFGDFRTLFKKSQVLLLIGFAIFIVITNWSNFSLNSIRQHQAESQTQYKLTETSDTGLLLNASCFTMTQYFTRRPILLDVSVLDSLCYAPKLAPIASTILREVYGIDFFNPPVQSRRKGGVWPGGTEREMWESWSLERWKTMREKHRVIDVLVPSDWKLQLPVKVHAPIGLIYHIPAEE